MRLQWLAVHKLPSFFFVFRTNVFTHHWGHACPHLTSKCVFVIQSEDVWDGRTDLRSLSPPRKVPLLSGIITPLGDSNLTGLGDTSLKLLPGFMTDIMEGDKYEVEDWLWSKNPTFWVHYGERHLKYTSDLITGDKVNCEKVFTTQTILTGFEQCSFFRCGPQSITRSFISWWCSSRSFYQTPDFLSCTVLLTAALLAHSGGIATL